MRKTLFILLFIQFVSCSKGQKLFFEDYSFLLTDGEVTKLHQSNDTLYSLKCYFNIPCQPKPELHSKILSSEKKQDYIILKQEALDTIPLTTNPYPATRYSLVAIKLIDNKKLGFTSLASGLTKQQIDTIHTDFKSLNEKFFFTFFSDTYLIELSSLKKITTKQEVQEILDAFKSDQYKTIAEKYSKTITGDIYGSGFSAEILNRVCVEKGFNPIGAGLLINKLMRQ